ncbi:MAG TPA: CARDB domain-containing protein [Candidatus Norongarragalinales archaeon]|nr:CARDB domain-containing protein [Candidatus Norongarragalinales archaeon]
MDVKICLVALFALIVAAIPASAAGPDLIINSLTFSKANPVVGETVTVTIQTKNVGTSSTLVASTTQLNRPGGNTDYPVAILAANGIDTDTYSFTCPSASTYTFTATADIYGGVAESNETNNGKSATLNCLTNKPELYINSFTSSKSNPTVGETVTLTIVTKNNGNVASVASTTRVTKPLLSPVDLAVGALAVGAVHTGTTTYTCIGAGPVTFMAAADNMSTNSEISETNNTKTLSITCGNGTDYIIQNLTFSKSNPVVGEAVTITVITKNLGPANSAVASTTRLNKPGGAYTNFAVPALNAGAIDTDTTTYTCPSIGTFSFTPNADQTKVVTESNELNNNITGTLNCGSSQPDLVIDAINFSNANPKIGDTVTVYIYTKNIGGGASGISTTGLRAPVSQDFTISALNAGASLVKTLNYTCPSVGAKTFSAFADIYSVISETNEANNGKNVTLTCADTANLMIWEIQLSGTMMWNTPVTATVITKNTGQATSKPNTVTRVEKPGGASSFYIPALAPGVVSSNSITFNCGTAGVYYVTATADYTNIESEYDESNSKMKGFNCYNPGANLIVSMAFKLEPIKKKTGTVTIVPRNNGDQAAGPSQTAAGSNIFNIPSLAKGQQAINTMSISCSGNRAYLTATADIGDTVSEGNEGDNVQDGVFNCLADTVGGGAIAAKGYDIQIGNMSVSPYVLAVIVSLLVVGAWYVSQNASKGKGKKR